MPRLHYVTPRLSPSIGHGKPSASRPLAFRASRPCQSRMSLFFPVFSEKGKTGRIPDESFQKSVQKRTKGR